MKSFIALAVLLPLVASAPNTGSYASFTQHGQSFGYNSNGGSLSYAHKPTSSPYQPQESTYQPHPYHAEPSYKPEPYHTEPAYKPESYHPEPTYKPAPLLYRTSALAVQQEVCTPAFKTECEDVELPIKKITDGEYCYDVARTVCTESIEQVDNEVCSYTYEKKYEDTTAQTVEVTFKKESSVQMVTVCQPGYGHGYQAYGQQYCKEVAQETQYNVPMVAPLDVDVRVGYPEPVKACVNKPIALPQISCEVITENKCVVQPQIEEATETVQKCVTSLGEPACQKVELTLPKQRCVELVYGYAEDAHKQEEYAQ
eukprot:TCALIF_09767-PA protein Name:"Protein of unknown function" AED:0.39 eAED:0.39 QI:0/0/0/0.5/1/1/2/0/312